jgi:hypothetical protein
MAGGELQVSWRTREVFTGGFGAGLADEDLDWSWMKAQPEVNDLAVE